MTINSDDVKLISGVGAFLFGFFYLFLRFVIGPSSYGSNRPTPQTEEQKKNEKIYNTWVDGICITILVVFVIIFVSQFYRKQENNIGMNGNNRYNSYN